MADGRFFSELFPKHPFSGLTVDNFPDDQQSFFSDADVFTDLIRLTRPDLIIEVGTWKGHSANAMADICKREKLCAKIVCVDTWLGSLEHYTIEQWRPTLQIEHGRPTLWERFIGNTMRRMNHDCIYPFPLPASTASAIFADMEAKANLIYIDGSHEYDDVLSDIRHYFPLLETGGIMFGDHFHHQPIERAVRDYAIEVGIGIATKGSKWVLLQRGGQLCGQVGYEILLPIAESAFEGLSFSAVHGTFYIEANEPSIFIALLCQSHLRESEL